MAALSAARAAAVHRHHQAVDRVATAGHTSGEAEDDVRAAIEAGANVAETAITVGKRPSFSGLDGVPRRG